MTGFFDYVAANAGQILTLLGEHVRMTAVAVLVSILVGVPLGILISRYNRLSKPVLGFANIMQALPSMAVLGFMIPLFGIGQKPAILMVMLYALLPIVKNTSTGLLGISRETLEVSRGIGMTETQILFRVQLPMALPVIMAGVRISAVNAVGLMTLASYIGAGGLGYLIYSGVQMVDSNMILAGTIPACLLALAMDWVFAWVERAVTPISLTGVDLPTDEAELEKLRRSHRRTLWVVGAALAVLLVGGTVSGVDLPGRTVSVTSAYYPEQMILGNMAAELIEAHTDLEVERKLNMGGSDICFSALKNGELDVQIGYTGTMYASILKQPVEGVTAQKAYDVTKQMFHDEYALYVGAEWGFNNTYALAVRRETAEQYGLETVSDLIAVSRNLILSPTFEFANRPDGLPGLQTAYSGLEFKEVVPMDGALRYTAIDNRECDVIVAYSTDSMIRTYDLVVLEDDRGYFLPYYAMPVVREEVVERYPEVADALELLAGVITDSDMVEMNYQVENQGRKPEDVAREYLQSKGLL